MDMKIEMVIAEGCEGLWDAFLLIDGNINN
jgi:hypothetical protein